MQQRLRQTDEELDNLIGVRSRAISRKLRSVQSLDEAAAATLLELDAPLRSAFRAGQLPQSGKPVAGRQTLSWAKKQKVTERGKPARRKDAVPVTALP